METLAYLSLVIVLLYIIVRAADLIEEGFVFIARKLKINEFFIGFAILGVATSLPEIAIAITSKDTLPELSIANLFGGSTILLTLIVGTSVVRYGNIEFKGKFREKELFLALITIFATIFIVLDKNLTMFEGILLMSAYVLYIAYVSNKYRRSRKQIKESEQRVLARKVFVMMFKGVAGIVALLICSSVLVNVAELIIERVEFLNAAVLGLIVLSIGTNTPEITLLITAKKRGKGAEKLVLGNFLGSATVNTGIMGMLSVTAGGIEIKNFVNLVPVMVILTFTLILFAFFSWTGRKINKQEGILLASLYFAFIITEAVAIFMK